MNLFQKSIPRVQIALVIGLKKTLDAPILVHTVHILKTLANQFFQSGVREAIPKYFYETRKKNFSNILF